MKVLVFGSMNIDNVYYMDKFVQPGETKEIDKLEINPGGKGLNQSIALSRAGTQVYHAGYCGNGGEFLLKYLEENKVNVKFIEKTETPQGHAMIQVNDSGENSIIVYPGSNYEYTQDYIDNVLEDFDEETIVVLQNEINELEYIIKEANRRNMITVFNPSPLSENLFKIDYSNISWLILNEIEIKLLMDTKDIDLALSLLQSRYPTLNVILTLGGEGSISIFEKKKYEQPAFQTKVVDTTGAGDTFTGYFVSGLSKGGSIQEILKNATRAASLCISKKGAAPSIPYIHEILE